MVFSDNFFVEVRCRLCVCRVMREKLQSLGFEYFACVCVWVFVSVCELVFACVFVCMSGKKCI